MRKCVRLCVEGEEYWGCAWARAGVCLCVCLHMCVGERLCVSAVAAEPLTDWLGLSLYVTPAPTPMQFVLCHPHLFET
jgi:hypothetical protein